MQAGFVKIQQHDSHCTFTLQALHMLVGEHTEKFKESKDEAAQFKTDKVRLEKALLVSALASSCPCTVDKCCMLPCGVTRNTPWWWRCYGAALKHIVATPVSP